MWLQILFISIWALSPGPVMVVTIREARKHGSMLGIIITAGASLMAAVAAVAAFFIHSAGFSKFLSSDNLQIVEYLGAACIILMGGFAAYKSMTSSIKVKAGEGSSGASPFAGFALGMMLMAANIPQLLIFYNVIIPQTIEPAAITTTIVMAATVKVLIIFVWHSTVAILATRLQHRVSSERFGRAFEFATACLIMGMGVNILV